ncbi:MAG: hypothetical protein JRJ46_13720 [Deltaproteobacteria bacterium]|nr:hypothetical protein [Deltaproteobacteria bacterium]
MAGCPAFSGISASLQRALVAQASPEGYAGQAGCEIRVGAHAALIEERPKDGL